MEDKNSDDNIEDKQAARRRYYKERRERNKEASLERERAYVEANRDKIRAYQKAWRKANAEHVKQYDREHSDWSRKWQKDNRDKHNANVAAYNERNRDTIQTKSRDRHKRRLTDIDYLIGQRYSHAMGRARKMGMDFNLTREYLLSIYPTNGKCPMFGTDFDLSRQQLHDIPSLDRIDNDRGYVQGNVWFISNRANLLKKQSDVNGLKKRIKKMEADAARGKVTKLQVTVDELKLILAGLIRKLTEMSDVDTINGIIPTMN